VDQRKILEIMIRGQENGRIKQIKQEEPEKK